MQTYMQWCINNTPKPDIFVIDNTIVFYIVCIQPGHTPYMKLVFPLLLFTADDNVGGNRDSNIWERFMWKFR